MANVKKNTRLKKIAIVVSLFSSIAHGAENSAAPSPSAMLPAATPAPSSPRPSSAPKASPSTTPQRSAGKVSQSTAPPTQGAPKANAAAATASPTQTQDPLKSIETELVNNKKALEEVEKHLKNSQERHDKIVLDRNEQKALSAATKNAIILETEDFLLRGQGTNQSTASLRKDYAEQVNRLNALDKQYTDLVLRIKQLERNRAKLKAKVSEWENAHAGLTLAKDKVAISKVRLQLKKEIQFSHDFSFKCSPSKSVSACLAEKEVAPLIHEEIVERYIVAVQKSPGSSSQKIDESEFRYEYKHTFTEARMDISGNIFATAVVNAKVSPRASLACTTLNIQQQLCFNSSKILTVRSNKHDDQVTIDGTTYGSTPVSVALPVGEYTLEVIANGSKKQQKIKLDKDRLINVAL